MNRQKQVALDSYKSQLRLLPALYSDSLQHSSEAHISDMQFKALATLVLGATATLAAATGSPSNQCNTGSAQCCQSTGQATDPSIATLLGLLGVAVQGVTALVGVTCSPISIIGVSGTSW